MPCELVAGLIVLVDRSKVNRISHINLVQIPASTAGGGSGFLTITGDHQKEVDPIIESRPEKISIGARPTRSAIATETSGLTNAPIFMIVM